MDNISRVVIGMDPHKRSATIEAMGPDEQVPGGGRFGTDRRVRSDARPCGGVAGPGVGGRGLRRYRQALGAAAAGRSPPADRGGPHPDRLPAAPDPAGTASRRARKALSAAQARKLLTTVRPKDAAGKVRKRAALELAAGPERLCARKKAANKELAELVKAAGTALTDLHGIGPSCAPRLLAEVGDITRFPSKG
jgi:predicted flap endonuclease-1-like 5' DNA nuclease